MVRVSRAHEGSGLGPVYFGRGRHILRCLGHWTSRPLCVCVRLCASIVCARWYIVCACVCGGGGGGGGGARARVCVCVRASVCAYVDKTLLRQILTMFMEIQNYQS